MPAAYPTAPLAQSNVSSSVNSVRMFSKRSASALSRCSLNMQKCSSRLSERGRLVVTNIAEFTRAAPSEAILCAKIRGHTASVGAAMIIEDSGEMW